MNPRTISTTVAVIGGGVVGTAVLHGLAHRGVPAVLLEAEGALALAASGTNSGILHTGFDSVPGELETQLILRSAELRPAVLESLNIPVSHCGAVLVPRTAEDGETIRELAANAQANGVETHVREDDGALLVPGESVTDPVAYTTALADSAVAAGARVELGARVAGIDQHDGGLVLRLEDGGSVECRAAINCAGLHADDVARLAGDASFDIYPRKGEFFVFELPGNGRLDHIKLPAPTKRTKGVLVFPTLDGRVVAGPTAVDLEDKSDWSVRAEAHAEVLQKAVDQFPELSGLEAVASYAGLRPAGRETNYAIGPSAACPRLVNVAAIRSTGLSASLGIAEHVAGLLRERGIKMSAPRPPAPARPAESAGPWWQRTARHHSPAR